jgi:hypothetical protein
VKFGSVSALTFNINSSAQIQTVVPSGADTGPITVITTNAVARSATDFVVLTTPPVNDNFANRITIVGATRTVLGSNAGANKETNEPNHANQPGGKSVWWTWTPPASGTYSITTRGSGFDTLVGIYTGSTLATLTKVASDDDGPNMDTESLVTFDAVGGTVYQVAVDGYGGDAGNIVLSVYPDTASQNFVLRWVRARRGLQALRCLSRAKRPGTSQEWAKTGSVSTNSEITATRLIWGFLPRRSAMVASYGRRSITLLPSIAARW